MDLQEARKRLPILASLDDATFVDAVHQKYYSDINKADFAKWMGYKMPEAPAPERSTMRAMGDLATQFGGGVVSGVRMMTDTFGADNMVSGGLRSVEDALQGLQSAAAKHDQQRIAQIMQEADGKGWGEQVALGLKAAMVAPGAVAAQSLGTAVPTLATALIPGAGPMAMAMRSGAAGAIGAAQGAGNIKGVIYEDVKRELAKANPGMDPQMIEAKAVEAQSYGGENAGQIALGGALGVAAGTTGMERAVSGLRNGVTKAPAGMMGRMFAGGAAEAAPEFAQGGQEKYASNVAQAGQGLNVDPWNGVVAQGTMEGVAGFGPGAVTSMPAPQVKTLGQEAADVVRANELVQGTGPTSRAANAGTELKAKEVEASIDSIAKGASQVNPNAGPPDQEIDDPIVDLIARIPDEKERDDAARSYRVMAKDGLPKGILDANKKRFEFLLSKHGLSLDGEADVANTADVMNDATTLPTVDQVPQQASPTLPEHSMAGTSMSEMLQGRTDPLAGMVKHANAGVDMETGEVPAPVVNQHLTTQPVEQAKVAPLEPKENPLDLSAKTDEELQAMRQGAQDKTIRNKLAVELQTRRAKAKAATIPTSTDSSGRKASWVIRDKSTGTPVFETFDEAKVKALNTEKYEAVPIGEHLASLNTRDAFKKGQEVDTSENHVKETPKIEYKPDERFGIDHTAFSEGGKPFKTKLAADRAKKMQPMMRVVKVDGGFALAEKTEKQIAAQTKSARRFGLASVGKAGVPLSAHEFIASEGGLTQDAKADLGIEKNVLVGNRHLFAGAGKGLSVEQATEKLASEGYIKEHDQNAALEIIKKSIQTPQYTPDGWESIAQAELDTRYEDHLAAQEDFEPNDPFAPLTELDMEDIEYDSASEELQAQVRALVELAEATGIDAEGIMQDAARETQNESEQAYYESANKTLQTAINESARSLSNEQASGPDQAGQEHSKANIASGQDGSQDSRGQGDETAKREAKQGEVLSSYTAQEVEQRKADQDKAEQERKKQEADAERKAQADAERDTFTLTGSDRPADVAAARGQQDIFGNAAPADQAPETPKLADMTAAELKQQGRDDFAAGEDRQVAIARIPSWKTSDWVAGWNEAKADADAKAEGKVVMPSEFPTAEVDASYSHISHSGTARARSDRDEFVSKVQGLYDEASALAETDAQRTALDAAIKTYKDEYLSQTRALMNVRAGTYSGYVAGRGNLNAKQANKGNSALDKAIDRFVAWDKAAAPRVKNAVLAARTPEKIAQLQAEEAAKKADQLEKRQRKDMEFMAMVLAFKPGDTFKVGTMLVTKVTNDKEGYPLTLTIKAEDGAALTDDKLNLATEVFGKRGAEGLRAGKEKIRSLVDAVKKEQSDITKPVADGIEQTGRETVDTSKDKKIGVDSRGRDVFEGTQGSLKGVRYTFDERGKVNTGATVEEAAVVPSAAKKKPQTAKQKREALENHFRPGNVIQSDYFKEFDRVVDFAWNDGNWKVTVEKVVKDGEVWKATEGKRTHMTTPDARDKVVFEAPVPEAAPEAKAEPAPAKEAEPAKPASKTPKLDSHMETMKAVRDGAASPEQYKAGFVAVADNVETIKAELNTQTKEALLRSGGLYFYQRHKQDTKPEIVAAVYGVMLEEYALGKQYGPTGYVMGQRKTYEAEKAQALRDLVDGQTAETLAEHAAEVAASREEFKAKREAKKQAIENPQTLEDFNAAMRVKVGEGMTRQEAFLSLTPEQRTQYDELDAESTRKGREDRKRTMKTQVMAAGQTTGGEIVPTKHTRSGDDLFVVKLAERVSREDYGTLLSSAKKLGGWYSSFRGSGAVPGFQFKEMAKAEAFLKLAAGDTTAAQEQVEQRRDAFEDDRSQSAAERLNEMADALQERAEASLSQERKANTARRARFAASAEREANEQKALAQTMRNIAKAIEDGKAKFLDAVRQKVQIEFLRGAIRTAKDAELRAKYQGYSGYAEQEKRKGEPPTAETADFSEFPAFTAFRSDLASLARQLLEVGGTKKMGQQIMSVADDVTDAYLEFAKANILKVSAFGASGKFAEFGSKADAEAAIRRSGLTGKAIVLPVKRGENRVILSPSEAINRQIWTGDGDKRITLSREFGMQLVEAIGRRGNKQNRLTVPWQFQNAADRLKMLARMGIETGPEYRSALREFIGLQERATEDKVRKMELAMVGRKADGLDFFPTPETVADQMIEAAEIAPEMSVLEPSAGMGHIADRIREAGAEPEVIEISPERRELLQEKGYNTANVDDFMDLKARQGFTFGDLMRAPDGTVGILRGQGGLGSERVRLVSDEADPRELGKFNYSELEGVEHRGDGYDRIIMNPPFSERRDAQHVQHAYTLLKPGGRIVAIMGEGVFFGSDKKAEAFREWLEKVGGTSEKLPPGSFQDPSLPVTTGVNARMVVIDKPATAAGDTAMFSRSPATQQAYEARIDALFAGEKANLSGVHLLDKSDVMDLLGLGNMPVRLDEAKVVLNQTNHPEMTAEVWKKIPEWLDNPALVTKSSTVDGRYVITPSEAVLGYAVRIVVEPKGGAVQVHALVNAYAPMSANGPIMEAKRIQGRIGRGDVVYVDTKKASELLGRSGLQLPRVPSLNTDRVKILTEKNLSGYRKAQDPAMSRGFGTGMTKVDAQDVVKGITDRWDNAPEVVVVQDMQDAAVPDAVRREDAKQKSQGASGEPEGFFHDGKAYIVAGALRSPGAVMRVLFHETLGHYGLRGTFGDGLTPILKQLAALRRSEVAAKAEQYGLDMSIEADRLTAAEEVLAEMAQSKPDIGFVKRVVALIRGFLRKNVPGFQAMGMTDEDIIANYILPARAFVERGGRDAQSKVASFSRVQEQVEPLDALRESDDLFAMPKSEGVTIAEIIQDHDPEITVKEVKIPGNETFYNLTMPDGTTARITVRKSGPSSVYDSVVDGDNNSNFESGRPGENPEDVDPYAEDVWIDVSRLKPGQNGIRVYSIASTFAHNTGRIFIGDPNGLSDEAMRRRAENMLSSALKFGTTKHLAPHPRQTVGGAGVPALKWVYGDDVGNIEKLIDLNLKSLDNANPNAKFTAYNLDTGAFTDTKSGAILGRSELDAAYKSSGRSAMESKAQAGWRTIARGAVFRAILGRGGAQGNGAGRSGASGSVLAELVRQREKLASPIKDERVFYSRSVGATALTAKVRDELGKTFTHSGELSWWHKSVGSQYNLAERNPAYKRVFDAAQSFINDVSYYGSEAANMAPKILPKLETLKDLAKTAISAADNKAVAAPVFEGTLSWTRDANGKPVKIDDLAKTYESLSFEDKSRMLMRKNAISEAQLKNWKASPLDIYESAVQKKFEETFLKAGLVWKDQELSAMFKLTPDQIDLYKEFRAATDTSLDNMAKAQMLREGGEDMKGMHDAVMAAPDADTAAMMVREFLLDVASGDPDRADMLTEAANSALDSAAKVNELKKQGYAPLSRFGRFTVDVVVNGEREFFGLFETKRDANNAAAKMRMEFGAENVEQGTMSQKEFELFQGITPESLELFGNMLGLDATGNEAQDKAFQTYLKLTKNNRSAMKRLIHRKGIAGYSEDVGRVLASFVYSNARQTSAALHIGEMDEAINAIPKGQGELKDHAMELADYVKKPQEEAAALRGMLFAQYLGGSVASAMVNFTQPLTVSIPYLSQFGGLAKAGKAWAQAVKDMAKGTKLETGLELALKAAEESGVVSPQEVHQLMAQARGAAVLKGGDGTRYGDSMAKVSNGITRASLAWGKLFGYAEQVNRRSTFIAAYRIAVENNNVNPAAFAEKAVNETQFVNNKANKMKFGRGAIGATLMTFKSYSIHWLELMHRLSTQDGKEGKLAAAYMLGALFLMSGASGLPFAGDVEDLIDAIAQKSGYNFSSKKAKQEFLEEVFGKDGADFVDRGLTGIPGVPIDLSGRMGMSNLLPGTGLLLEKRDKSRDMLELAGPVGDMSKRAFESAGSLLSGEFGSAIDSAAPRALSNLFKGADMANTGMYRDSRGAKVIDTTMGEAMSKMIGFQPSSVAQVQEANYINQRAKDFYTLRAQDMRSKWAQGIFEGDAAKVAEARQMMIDWNEDNPDQRMTANMPSIIKRVREMRKDKAQRIADTAPKSMRAQMKADARELSNR